MKSMKTILVLSVLVASAVFASQDSDKKEYKNGYNDWKNKPIEKFSNPEANFNKVKEMLLKSYFDSKITDEALYEAATRGMLTALNPSAKDDWNKLYSPEEFKEFQVDAKGEVTGIGIEIKFNDETGTASITHVIPHSSAEKAQVKVGDQLVSINDKLSKGLQFRDLVYSIRGKVGESVKLKLLRGDEIVTKKITREKINWSPIETVSLDPRVALIKINYFNEKSSDLLKEALQKVILEHVTSLIIDLRDDEGGLFDKSVEAASFFTPNGKTIARLESRDGSERKLSSTAEPLVKGISVAVLVSEKTSSGAELFAGSLSETIGAKLIGMPTHGKWSAQTLETLDNGFAVKFTTSVFKTPSGKSYAGVGLEPDVMVNLIHDESESLKDEAVKTAYNLLVGHI